MDSHRPWGWRLVNHLKYRSLRDMEQKREADRKRISEKRKQIKDVAIESQSVANVAHSDSDTDSDSDTRKAKTGRAIALPDWLPSEEWFAWLEARRRMKAPNTDRALKLAIKDLEKLRADGHDPGGVLDQSTKRGWRALFPVSTSTGAVPDYSGVAANIKD